MFPLRQREVYTQTLTLRLCHSSRVRQDWVVLSWRYELHLLSHAFPIDAADSDRLGVPEDSDMTWSWADGQMGEFLEMNENIWKPSGRIVLIQGSLGVFNEEIGMKNALHSTHRGAHGALLEDILSPSLRAKASAAGPEDGCRRPMEAWLKVSQE